MVSCLAPGGGFLWSLYIFHVEKVEKKVENLEGSLNTPVLERIAKLTMHLESLSIEVEVLGKQKVPVGGE